MRCIYIVYHAHINPICITHMIYMHRIQLIYFICTPLQFNLFFYGPHTFSNYMQGEGYKRIKLNSDSCDYLFFLISNSSLGIKFFILF